MNKKISLIYAITYCLCSGCDEQEVVEKKESEKELIKTNKKCNKKAMQENIIECRTISVPRDHKYPEEEKITLKYITITPLKKENPELMFINYGGPGNNTILELEKYTSGRLAHSRSYIEKNYTIVGLNPRGIGDDVFFKEIQKTKDEDREYQEKYDQLVSSIGHLVSTEQVVDDIEAIRKQLKADTVNIYGYSYGTKIAGLYMHKYPDTTKGIIMNSLSNINTDNRLETIYEKALLSYKNYEKIFSEILKIDRKNKNFFFAFNINSAKELYESDNLIKEKKEEILEYIDQYYKETTKDNKEYVSRLLLKIVNCVDDKIEYSQQDVDDFIEEKKNEAFNQKSILSTSKHWMH